MRGREVVERQRAQRLPELLQPAQVPVDVGAVARAEEQLALDDAAQEEVFGGAVEVPLAQAAIFARQQRDADVGVEQPAQNGSTSSGGRSSSSGTRPFQLPRTFS